MAREVTERDDVIPVLGEIFREHGFAGASLSTITRRTGLGKGSLYNFFPDGKNEMAEAVLDDVAHWFETNVFLPLRDAEDPDRAIEAMFEAVDRYFRSGERICLVGAFALDDTRDRFADRVNAYFTTWTQALAGALRGTGLTTREAREAAEDIVVAIQGALVLARSRNDPGVFGRTLKRLRKRIPPTGGV